MEVMFTHDKITFLQGTNDFHSIPVNLKVKLNYITVNSFLRCILPCKLTILVYFCFIQASTLTARWFWFSLCGSTFFLTATAILATWPGIRVNRITRMPVRLVVLGPRVPVGMWIPSWHHWVVHHRASFTVPFTNQKPRSLWRTIYSSLRD